MNFLGITTAAILMFNVGLCFASTKVPLHIQTIADSSNTDAISIYSVALSIDSEKNNGEWQAWPWKVYSKGKIVKLASQNDLIKYLTYDKSIPFGLYGLSLVDYLKHNYSINNLRKITSIQAQIQLAAKIYKITHQQRQALVSKFNVIRSPISTPKIKHVNHQENDDFNTIITKYSKVFNVPTALIKAIIQAESEFNPNAKSNKGALGLMQVMPATAKSMNFNPRDLYRADTSIHAGTKYIALQLKEFGNLSLALAAYNAGPGAVKKYNFSIPPYKETQKYVKKVKKFYRYFSAKEKGKA